MESIICAATSCNPASAGLLHVTLDQMRGKSDAMRQTTSRYLLVRMLYFVIDYNYEGHVRIPWTGETGKTYMFLLRRNSPAREMHLQMSYQSLGYTCTCTVLRSTYVITLD